MAEPEAAQEAPQDPIDEVMGVFNILGMTNNQANGLIQVHNLTSMNDFGIMRPEHAQDMLKSYNATSGARTLANKIGLLVQIKLEGFLYWYHNQHKRGISPNGAEFDVNTCTKAVNEYAAFKKSGDSAKSDSDFDIGKIKTGLEWYTFKDGVENMAKTVRGTDGDPLYYVIRPEQPNGWTPEDDWERDIYQLPHSGPIYEKDQEIFWSVLVKATAGTNAWEWVKAYEKTRDARAAWMCLLLKCEGTDATNKRIQHAQNIVSMDFSKGGAQYTYEYNYSFEDYYTKLQAGYRVLSRYDNEVPATLRIRRLLDGMTVQGEPIQIEMAKSHILDNYKDWDGAVSYMSTKISIAFPPREGGNKRKRDARRISEAGRGGRGRGRGRGGRGRGGRGGRGGNSNRHDPDAKWYHGVDCRDPGAKFSQEDWRKMGDDGRDYITSERKKYREAKKLKTSSKRDGDTKPDEAGSDDDAKNLKKAKGGNAGSQFGKGASKRSIRALKTGRRYVPTFERSAKRAKTNRPEKTGEVTPGTRARNELDTRADTICVGANWRLLSTTGQCCNVHGFHSDFEAIEDVPVARAATAIQNEDGAVYILIVNEALYFGASLDHSLINPNQIRHFGIPVSDDPYDNSRDFGIDHEDIFIPFSTAGSTVYFESYAPTDEDLEKYPHIILTDDEAEWDPAGVEMQGDDKPRTTMRIEQAVTERERRSHVPVECESDLCLGSISDHLVPDRLYERLVSSVNISVPTISRTKKLKPMQLKKVTAHSASCKSIKKIATTRHTVVSYESLARMMNITLDKAKEMMRVTTQKGVRTAVHPITRRYRVNHLDLHSSRLAGQWYVDWLSAGTKSLAQNKGAFVYSDGLFTEVYPSESNKQGPATTSLREFCEDVGVPEKLKSDRAPEFCGRNTEFHKVARKKGINLTYAEPERKNQISPIDVEIREIRARTSNKLKSKGASRRLWDYCLTHQSKLRQFLPRQRLQGRTAYEHVTGKTPDISEYCDFDFYDLVWYHAGNSHNFGEDRRALGRWLGVSHRVGSDMCYWILPASGQVISETTVQHVTREDLLDPAIKDEVERFNATINERLDDENFHLPNDEGGFTLDDEYELSRHLDPAYGDNDPTPDEYGEQGEPILEADDVTEEMYDKFLGAKFILDEKVDGGGRLATVKRRAKTDEGKPIGRAHVNPMLDTREYDIELENGEHDRIMANQIAANLYSQLDDEGREIMNFKGIVDHKHDGSALTKDNGFYETKSGEKKCKKTTRGWKILVEWHDDTSDWIDLKDVKEANPIELAEYAINNKIDDEPAFAWWVPYVIRKRERIIAKAKTKYWRTTHKYGVRLPKTAAKALQLDKEMGSPYWENAMKKEMGKAQVAYEEVPDVTPDEVRRGEVDELKGFQEITCHIVFDVKMDFTRKARFVANGAMTETPIGLCYSIVVSRDSVRIAFLVAALNDLDVLACDIGNAYLNAPCREKIWFKAGLECGNELAGKVCKLVRALYGLKSSGASWRKMFKDHIVHHMGFTASLTDPDMYYRKSKKPDGTRYYELLLVYVDDVLAIGHDPMSVMKVIRDTFEIKNDEITEPRTYLGADIEKFQLPNGKTAWSITANTYVKNAVNTVQALLAEDGRELKSGPRKHKGPLPSGYKPELDTTDECNAEMTSRYQQLIGILRWAVELGRVDIMIEVALMSQYQMNPRLGHLEALYLIFHYLWKNPRKRLVMDPIEPVIDESVFNNNVDWGEFYGDVIEEDPPKMPEPLGRQVSTSTFVDANHASNVITRRSHSGIFMFVNNALIDQFSKRQNTVESSTYGSELVAMRIARDKIVALRIKLKSIGVPLMGPTNLFCDNQGVVKNTSIPESTLSKKHNSINYHVVRESAAAGILRVGKEDTDTNIADAATKLLPYSKKMELLGSVLYDY